MRTLALAAIGLGACSSDPATCLPDACFCEAVRGSVPRQPADTWSSAAYALAGLVAVALRPRSRGLGFAGALFALAVGSALFHATLTFQAQWLDLATMGLVASVAIFEDARALFAGAPRATFAIGVAAFAIQGVSYYAWAPARRVVFAVVVAVTAAAELVARRRLASRDPWLPTAAAVFVASFAVWALDLSHVACSPRSPLQGHAFWHVGTAAGLLLLHLSHRARGHEATPMP